MIGAASRARRPFRFSDYEGLVVATGWEAHNLRELIEIVRRAPGDVIHHHLFRTALSHRYGTWDHPNDFGHWAAVGLGDPVLAEKLSNLDVFHRGETEDTRAAVLDLLEEHLETQATVPWARPGFEFHFLSGIYFEIPGLREAWNVEELQEAIREIPLSCLYFHFHEARLRGADDEDDFSRWLRSECDRPDLTEKLRGIDFYLFSLEELRQRILAVLDEE